MPAPAAPATFDLAALAEGKSEEYGDGREGRTREILAYIVVGAFLALILAIVAVALVLVAKGKDPQNAMMVLTTAGTAVGPLAGGIVGYYYASTDPPA